jgi:hypothetical protein
VAAAGVGGVGLAGEQPSLLHAPDLVGEPALLPLHEGAQFLRGHLARGVFGEHGQDLVVGVGQPAVLEREPAQAQGELVVRAGPGTAKNAIRPVLITDHYDQEVERLASLGARPLNEVKVPAVRAGGATFSVSQTTFADPDGNEFDLVMWQQQPE